VLLTDHALPELSCLWLAFGAQMAGGASGAGFAKAPAAETRFIRNAKGRGLPRPFSLSSPF